MGRGNLFGLLVMVAAVSLLLAARPAPSEAALGCISIVDVPVGGLPVQSVATCDTVADCAPVGGTDCTGSGPSFCACPAGPISPFCPCLLPAAAPAVSHSALMIMAVLLSIIGLIQLWRRGRTLSRSSGHHGV